MNKLFTLLAAIVLLAAPSFALAAYGDTTTYVSKPYHGDGKSPNKAFFDFPEDIDVNDKGSFVIADTFNHVIRRITPKGKVKTIAGRGSFGDKVGGASEAEFAYPKGVAVGGGAVYVADSLNGKIKKIDNGNVTTLVADLKAPEAVEYYDGKLYFLETGNNALKRVSANGGAVSVVSKEFNDPKKISIDSNGAYAYVADSGSYRVKKVNLSNGDTSTLAGSGGKGSKDGSCSTATFNNLWGVHWLNDTTLFVSSGNGFDDAVRKIDLSDGCEVTTFASDTNMLSINFPRGLITHDGQLYVMATGLSLIQKYDLDDPNTNSKYAGSNRFNVKRKKPLLVGNPKALVLSKNKKWIYFSENNRIRRMKRKAKPKKTNWQVGSVIDNYVTTSGGDTNPRVGSEARFSDVTSFALSKNGKKLFVSDRNNNRIMEVNIKNKTNTYLTGSGGINLVGGESNFFSNGGACPNEFDKNVDGCAGFSRPQGVVLSKNGKYLFVADTGNNRIRKVVVRGDNKGKVTTIAGNTLPGLKNGAGKDAQFKAPTSLALSPNGKVLYVADRDNHVIRKIVLKTKEVTTYAGTGANGYRDGKLKEAVFSLPEYIHTGVDGKLYVSDVGGQQIRVIDRKAGVTKLVTGSGVRGYTNGSADKVRLNNPKGLLTLSKKTLLVSQLYNDVISRVDIRGTAPFTDPAPTISSSTPQAVEKNWFTGGAFAGVQIKGSNFRHGATAWVGPHKAVQTFVESDGSIVAQLPYTAMDAGYYTLRVENSDGQYSDKFRALGFSVNGALPVVDFYPPAK